MKKGLSLVLVLCLLFALCACSAQTAEETEEPAQTEEAAQAEETAQPEETEAADDAAATSTGVLAPMDTGMDYANITEGDFSIGFNNTSVQQGADGQITIDVTIYDYELYDVVDVHNLAVGDTFETNGESYTVETLEETDEGIEINGGLYGGGFTLISNEGGTYRLLDTDDDKVYCEESTVTLPVDTDVFELIDASDLDADEVRLKAEDLLNLEEGTVYTPYDTSMRVVDGKITSINHFYHP